MLWPSLILNDLYRPMSREMYPGARSTLRSPTSPGRAGRQLRYAATGSLNRFGVPFAPFLVVDVSSGRTRTPLDCTFQFVAQTQQSNGAEAIGSPLFQRKIPVDCQPPKTCSMTPPALPKNRLPRPIGSPITQFALMMCRESKSEVA